MSLAALLQKAIEAHQRGDLSTAKGFYQQLLRLEPCIATALANLAAVAIADRDYALAENYLRTAMSLRIDDPSMHSNLGVALRALGRLDEAVAAYQSALRLKPDYADVYHNLGNLLTEQSRLEEAVVAYSRAVNLKADYYEAYNNLGNALSELKRSEEALASYDKSLAVQPDFADAHLNRGILYLRNGELQKGWPDYEYRFLTGRYAAMRPATRGKTWRGEVLEGKSILVHTEQGLGDTIQFVRYLPLLARTCRKVIFAVPSRLERLFRPFAKVTTMARDGNHDEEADFETSLINLPYRLGTELGTIPRDVPYLFAEPELVNWWRTKLGSHGYKIGICWQGNPNYQDRDRSIPLSRFAALCNIPDLRLISLQKNHGLDQLARLPNGMTVETLGDDFDGGSDAFIDTAAVMSALDLVITSDTSVAHLAGALGIPVWLALKYAPHWTWMWDRSDSPWYPSMRLFRQPKPGDWDSVFSAVAAELRGRLNGSRPLPKLRDTPPTPVASMSWGELVDKITILEIKSERLTAPAALQNVRHELESLRELASHCDAPQLSELSSALRAANSKLWDIENAIRDKERRKQFDQEFIELARSVYFTNDDRGRIKREINALLKSKVVEEKQYTVYGLGEHAEISVPRMTQLDGAQGAADAVPSGKT